MFSIHLINLRRLMRAIVRACIDMRAIDRKLK